MSETAIPPPGTPPPPLPNPPPEYSPEPAGPVETGPSGMDVAVFIAGLAGILAAVGSCCCALGCFLSVPAGLFAWIAGSRERRRYRETSRQPPGLLTAGWILGIIATALGLLWIAFLVIYLLIVGTAFSLGAMKGL